MVILLGVFLTPRPTLPNSHAAVIAAPMSLTLYQELHNTVRARFGDSHSSQSMGDWICANTTIKRRPFSFRDYPFQRLIADDMHPDLSVKKCSQVGLTETQLRKFLAILARGNGLSGIFTLPNEKMFTRVYNTRLKPMIEQDEIFNPPMDVNPVRRRDTVQIRDSFGYITGCTEGDATSTPADFLMHDEIDLSPEDMIALYQSRLQNSEMKVTQKFSTPTFSGFGIDKSYSLSDQREYLYRCPACNHWQIPRFNMASVFIPNYRLEKTNLTELSAEEVATLDVHEAHFRCENPKCQQRADLSNADLREWVATFPGRTAYRGYQVRPTCTARLGAGYILGQLGKYASMGYPRGFHNTVLGEAYASADAQIQRSDIEACMTGGTIQSPGDDVPVFLGVDIGFQCHITLSVDLPDGRPHFILFQTIPVMHLETRIAELRQIYNIVQGASDRFPLTTTVDALRDHTNGLVMPIQYRGGAGLGAVRDELSNITHYSANRTLILDRVLMLISNHKAVLSGYTSLKETLIAHLTDMVRDEQPDVEAEWKKITGNDHFFHAMALNLLARRICEHMFHVNTDTVATSSMIVGAQVGPTSDHSLLGSTGKLSRLGRVHGS